jgi:hypothetical protein
LSIARSINSTILNLKLSLDVKIFTIPNYAI